MSGAVAPLTCRAEPLDCGQPIDSQARAELLALCSDHYAEHQERNAALSLGAVPSTWTNATRTRRKGE